MDLIEKFIHFWVKIALCLLISGYTVLRWTMMVYFWIVQPTMPVPQACLQTLNPLTMTTSTVTRLWLYIHPHLTAGVAYKYNQIALE